jgi:predicted nuclease of predicted toxin-antitoxin system
MILWVDAQLSPRIAAWLSATFGISASPLRELGLRDAEDADIFEAARKAGAVVLTKDPVPCRWRCADGPART